MNEEREVSQRRAGRTVEAHSPDAVRYRSDQSTLLEVKQVADDDGRRCRDASSSSASDESGEHEPSHRRGDRAEKSTEGEEGDRTGASCSPTYDVGEATIERREGDVGQEEGGAEPGRLVGGVERGRDGLHHCEK